MLINALDSFRIFTHTPSTDSFFFFFNDTATTEIYTLSLHDALPIYHDPRPEPSRPPGRSGGRGCGRRRRGARVRERRSEEHTSELQSPCNIVCRLLLEKKKIYNDTADLLRSYVMIRLHAVPRDRTDL